MVEDLGRRSGRVTEPLAGDDVVVDATAVETRGIDIAAPAAAVWPWLVQMGYGRAGWYSHDAVDMAGASSDRIQPEHQSLAVGDVMPVGPAGGFVVRALEPHRSLVLSIDSDLVREQARATAADADVTPANLRAAEAVMSRAQPTEFRASWAFVVKDLGHGRSRLVERSRVRFDGGEQPWTRWTLPLMGFGVFVMMRRQLLGIRERAERHPLPEAMAA